MMKNVLLLICFFSFCACTESSRPRTPENLINSWTHAFEEETGSDDISIFRQSNSMLFLPSRFRDSYIFNADGTCFFMVLDPLDAHYLERGKYSYDHESEVISISLIDDQFVKALKVIELQPDFLRLELVD